MYSCWNKLIFGRCMVTIYLDSRIKWFENSTPPRVPTLRDRPVYPTCRPDGPVSVCVGDKVEVFWDMEGEWYEGEVIAVDNSDETYLVHYFADNEEHWHTGDMDIRRLE